MQKIKVAKCIGFCHGVRRAVDLTSALLDHNKKEIFALGPIIHNSRMMQALVSRGLKVVKDISSVKRGGVLILPSHGTALSKIEEVKAKGIKFIDAICPYVSSVGKICLRLKNEGYKIVIVGDRFHPETKSILSIVPDAIVIDKIRDLKDNLTASKIGIISQTTQLKEKFIRVAQAIKNNNPDKEIRIFNTICLDTLRRQAEAKKIAPGVDVMFVVGGKDSANTKRLAQLCHKLKIKTYHIQGPEDIRPNAIKNKRIGITSGASTPDWLVEEVIESMESPKNTIKKRSVTSNG